MKQSILFLLLFLLPALSAAQGNALWETDAPHHYSFVHEQENTIVADSVLNPLWRRLLYLKTHNKGTIRIVHIGDSHLQADLITTELRNGFRDFFGNAGRGIVFPYQLAKSNAPSDVASSSNVPWHYNRLAHPDNGVACGVSGFGIESSFTDATVNVRLKPVNGEAETFDMLQFFMGLNNNSYALTSPGSETAQIIDCAAYMDFPSACAELPEGQSAFTLAGIPGNAAYAFYGVSLEKKNTPGVIYHTIGVNGAQYSQYTATPLFWQQLPGLKADCYIISLGTNEAQRQYMTKDAFLAEVDEFIQKLRSVSPRAVIIITTPAASFYRMKRTNVAVKTVSYALADYCAEQHIALWDLFNISSGLIGAAGWRKNHLLGRDLVHYTKPGYQLQGQLFLQALNDSYNRFAMHTRY